MSDAPKLINRTFKLPRPGQKLEAHHVELNGLPEGHPFLQIFEEIEKWENEREALIKTLRELCGHAGSAVHALCPTAFHLEGAIQPTEHNKLCRDLREAAK